MIQSDKQHNNSFYCFMASLELFNIVCVQMIYVATQLAWDQHLCIFLSKVLCNQQI